MFTIKHVNFTGGETLYEGNEPCFTNAGSSGLTLSGAVECGVVTYTDAKGEVQIIHGGKVYIMNDAGKTVAVYELEKFEKFEKPAQGIVGASYTAASRA